MSMQVSWKTMMQILKEKSAVKVIQAGKRLKEQGATVL